MTENISTGVAEDHWDSWISGPRWAGITRTLAELARQNDVTLRFDVDNGWIQQTVSFSVTGEAINVAGFRAAWGSLFRDNTPRML